MSDIKHPNVMLDLETMGNGHNAAILAIGAVQFDLECGATGETFYEVIDLASSVASGGVMDASTVLWWMRQSDAARSAFNRPGRHIASSLQSFGYWLKELGDKKTIRIWGNGAAFDNVILSSAYRRLQLDIPWEYWNDRCYRTVKNMYPQVAIARQGDHHNALDDAESQARHLMAIFAQGIDVDGVQA